MAVDDIAIALIFNMAQGDTTDRQPGSGVEERFISSADVNVTGSGPYGCAAINLSFIDGTNNDGIIVNLGVPDMIHVGWRGKYVADNTNYWRVTHRGPSTGDYGFCTIVIS
jgi:hypothetical protein